MFPETMQPLMNHQKSPVHPLALMGKRNLNGTTFSNLKI